MCLALFSSSVQVLWSFILNPIALTNSIIEHSGKLNYIGKNGFTGVFMIFLILPQKHRLFVLKNTHNRLEQNSFNKCPFLYPWNIALYHIGKITGCIYCLSVFLFDRWSILFRNCRDIKFIKSECAWQFFQGQYTSFSLSKWIHTRI